MGGIYPVRYYFPTRDIEMTYLRESQKSSMCEWKGRASYYDLIDPRSSSTSPHNLASAKAWCYHQPTADFELIRDYVAFYACETLRCVSEIEPLCSPMTHCLGWWVSWENDFNTYIVRWRRRGRTPSRRFLWYVGVLFFSSFFFLFVFAFVERKRAGQMWYFQFIENLHEY